MSFVLAAAILCASPVVHDGDSLRCNGERIRIANIDAPEVAGSPKCNNPGPYAWCDFGAGEQARRALVAFLAQGRVMVERLGVDRYGRTLALVTVSGADAGDYLVSIGLAKPWR